MRGGHKPVCVRGHRSGVSTGLSVGGQAGVRRAWAYITPPSHSAHPGPHHTVHTLGPILHQWFPDPLPTTL